MLPSSDNPARILLFGRDRTLLELRARVLRSADIAAHIATDVEDFQMRISSPESKYRAVLCCYSTPQDHLQQIAAIAAQFNATLYQLNYFVMPSELIAKASELIDG